MEGGRRDLALGKGIDGRVDYDTKTLCHLFGFETIGYAVM